MEVTTAPKKASPKRVAAPEELNKRKLEQPNIMADPAIASLIQTAPRPECSPVSATVLERQKAEQARIAEERSLDTTSNGKYGSWVFVKNGNFKEEITFKDGKKFRFPGVLFPTKDKKLAEKILEVADLYNVCLK